MSKPCERRCGGPDDERASERPRPRRSPIPGDAVREYVLDANALVRLYRDAPGAATVENLIRQARSGSAHLAISVINLSEVAWVLARYFGTDKALRCIEAA